jgi:hypothetical protein
MKFMKALIPCLVFFHCSASVSARDTAVNRDGITPMHEFLRENADTTIIFRYTSNWIRLPEWFILSKKGDTLTAYSYQPHPFFDPRIELPEAMALKLKKRIVRIRSVSVDINDYFNPVYLDHDTIITFWRNVTLLNPWRIKDDAQEGTGCPVVKGKQRNYIFDAGGISVDLITKNEIRNISFYAPDFYQKECPRKGRAAILELEKYFLAHFSPFRL